MQIKEKIEILPVSLLDDHLPTVVALRRLARELHIELGWHYLLDLTWITHHLGPVNARRIMDAGAGTGLIQWYLAEAGAEVISVDRASRANLPLHFRRRFRVQGLRPSDLTPYGQVLRDNLAGPAAPAAKAKSQAYELASLAELRRSPGRVVLYNQDLKNLESIPADSLDAVVAVSALEHNSPEGLRQVVIELMRVLKPGGTLLATLCAASEEDRYHNPSQGWCYTDASLRRLFDLPDDTPSNYARYDALFAALKDCNELRSNLARFYSRSGDNGMPWGKWDPQYQPVGVCKIKGAGERG